MKRYRQASTSRLRRTGSGTSRTTPLPAGEPGARDGGASRRGRSAGAHEETGAALGPLLRGLSGSLALGLAVLALGILVTQIVAVSDGHEGPGTWFVVGHLFAAAVAIAAQRLADRRRGALSGVGVFGVLLATGAALWLFWWS